MKLSYYNKLAVGAQDINLVIKSKAGVWTWRCFAFMHVRSTFYDDIIDWWTYNQSETEMLMRSKWKKTNARNFNGKHKQTSHFMRSIARRGRELPMRFVCFMPSAWTRNTSRIPLFICVQVLPLRVLVWDCISMCLSNREKPCAFIRRCSCAAFGAIISNSGSFEVLLMQHLH